MKHGWVLHSPVETLKNKMPTPYCDNILNHDTNEGIVNLVTLMVKHNKTITKMKEL
jgi:hypothetical protein